MLLLQKNSGKETRVISYFLEYSKKRIILHKYLALSHNQLKHCYGIWAEQRILRPSDP